ncbi:hypothetical protein MA16_Dca015887 [Dendrobium catenatum]|uniref:Uncharacterized protein n=1 Tax=Dendrobium catenatum TaxID=906689 RepID=A0A2I0VMI9_9ASPA|nr:hypothetical protein MA16_Dca015887 [Dendrobium catenatum]
MDDGPDQDPMVPSSRAIVVAGLLSQRRYSTQHDRRILVDSHGLLHPREPCRPGIGPSAVIFSPEISAASRHLPRLGENYEKLGLSHHIWPCFAFLSPYWNCQQNLHPHQSGVHKQGKGRQRPSSHAAGFLSLALSSLGRHSHSLFWTVPLNLSLTKPRALDDLAKAAAFLSPAPSRTPSLSSQGTRTALPHVLLL